MTTKKTNSQGRSPLASAAAFFYGKSSQAGIPVLLAFLLGPPSSVRIEDVFSLYFAFSMPIALSAIALRFWTFGYVREKHFVVNGPYRYVRNPIELSALFAYVAGAVFLGLPVWYTLSVLFVCIVYMSFVAIHYEDVLKTVHGWRYLKYKERVRRWLPSSLPSTNAEKQEFSLAKALVHDRRGLIWIVLFLLVASIRSQWIAPFWG